MTIAVVAEKPSVARDLAAVLGARATGPGCLRGCGYVVTWAIGHLVGIAEPHEMNPRWKRWSLDDLPLLPDSWPLAVLEGTKAQFENLRRVTLDPAVTEIIAATDAGREGELIFRCVYRKTECKKPVKRLWISSLTPDAIRRGFAKLEDLRAFDPPARAALARSRADWLVGMNFSRAYSLAPDDQLSVGRVQTPTLAMVVNRELEVRAFVPEDYLEVWATFAAVGGAFEAAYVGPASEGTRKKDAARFAVAAPEAEEIAARTRSGSAQLAKVARETKRIPAFRRVYLEAGAVDLAGVALPLPAVAKKKGKKSKGRRGKGTSRGAPQPQVRAFIRKRGAKPPRPTATSSDAGLRDALKAWRLLEAKHRGIPAFRILTDRVPSSGSR